MANENYNNVSQDVLATAFLGLKESPDINTSNIEPNVIVFNGEINLKGEKTIKKGSHYTLDLPETEAYKYRFITNGGGNMLSQLKKSLQNLDGGPWNTSGRDGDLVIKNRNYNQRPIAKFTYWGGNGELLSFSAKTTRRELTLDASESMDINPDEKTLNKVSAQATSKETSTSNGPEYTVTPDGKRHYKPNLRRPPITTEGGKIVSVETGGRTSSGKVIVKANTPEMVKEQNKQIDLNYQPTPDESAQFVEGLKKKYTDLIGRVKNGDAEALVDILDVGDLGQFVTKRKTWVTKWVNPASYWNMAMGTRGVDDAITNDLDKTGSSNYYNRWELGYTYLKSLPDVKVVVPKNRPSMSIDGYGPGANQGGGGGMVQIAEYKEIEVPIDGSRMLTSIVPPTTNDIVKAFQEEITGTFKIMGHPEIESEKLLEIQGISDKYSGEWYIKNIKHRIDQSGYTCSGEVIKKGSTITTKKVISSSNLKGVYANLAKLAKARAERDKNGFNLDTAIKSEIEKHERESMEAGNWVNPDASYQVIVPKDFGTSTTGNIDMPVYDATEDIVNLDKKRTVLKEQAKKLLEAQEEEQKVAKVKKEAELKKEQEAKAVKYKKKKRIKWD